MRLLIVEDNPITSTTLKDGLRPTFAVDVSNTLEKAQQKLKDYQFDALLLDVLLPDGNGIDFIRIAHKIQKDIPIIIVSAKDAVHNKVDAFNNGASDYVTKPFSFEELICRINAAIRKEHIHATKENLPLIAGIQLDCQQRRAKYYDQDLKLNKKEFDILELLVANKGKILTRTVILEKIWNTKANITFNTIDAHIKNLRKKIESTCHLNVIETIRGVGYTIPASL